MFYAQASSCETGPFDVAGADAGSLMWCCPDGRRAVFVSGPAGPQACSDYVSTSTTWGQSPDLAWFLAGDIYEKSTHQPVPAGMAAHRARLDEKWLADTCWGLYRLLVFDKFSGMLQVFVDPCGQCCTYYRCHADGSVEVSASLTRLVDEGAGVAAVDENALRSYVCDGALAPGRTALSGIHVIPPGCMLRVLRSGGCQTRRIWDVERLLQDDDGQGTPRETPFDVLGSVLHRILKDSPASQTLLELSGGVESSSIALAVHDRGWASRCVAINHHFPGVLGADEWVHADAVGRHCDMALQRIDAEQCMYTPVDVIPRLPKPSSQLTALAWTGNLRRRFSRFGNALLINGHGGDAAFMAPPPFGAFIDAAMDGEWRRSITAIRDLSVQRRVPIAQVIGSGLRDLRRALDQCDATRPRGFIVRDQAAFATDALGPLGDLVHIRWRAGKRRQLATILSTLGEIEVHPRYGPTGTFFPYMSQPMIEQAARLPTYALFSRYHNRLPMRQSAFDATHLPGLWRRGKGATTGVEVVAAQRNLAHLKDVCLHGWCAGQGLIDVPKCEQAINRISHEVCDLTREVAQVYATEMFIRSWR